jgi:hypothetical protein
MAVKALIRQLIDRVKSKQKAPEPRKVQSREAQPEQRAPPEQDQPGNWRQKIKLEKVAGGGRAGYELKQGRVKPVEERQQRKAMERGRDGPGR